MKKILAVLLLAVCCCLVPLLSYGRGADANTSADSKWDLDGSGTVDISDVTYLLNWLSAPACTHEYIEKTVSPTDKEQGYTLHTCINCGDEYKDYYVTASTGLKYTLNSDGESYSVRGVGSCTDLDVIIPAEYNGKTVTNIGYTAFYNCSSLTDIVISNSVTSIDSCAFCWCDSLTSIVISDSVTFIGGEAFNNCGSLTSITYKGTIAQWNNISKESDWNSNTGKYTIHCTDGDISK